MVINFDFPLNIEDYVHRIGRTGRGGALGISYALFTKDNERLAQDLVKILQETNQHISDRLRQLSKSFVSNSKFFVFEYFILSFKNFIRKKIQLWSTSREFPRWLQKLIQF